MKEFRKGLSKEDQQAFDRLFDRAKFHTAAGVYMAHPYPLETILLSICLEHEKMLGDILDRSSPIKKAFNWSYPVEIWGILYFGRAICTHVIIIIYLTCMDL